MKEEGRIKLIKMSYHSKLYVIQVIIITTIIKEESYRCACSVVNTKLQ